MASQNYDSPFLDMVVLPVVWIAAFAAVSASITIPQQTSSLFHRKAFEAFAVAAYDGCRFSRWSPSYSVTQERFRRSEASCYPIPDRARALILLGSSKSEDTPNIAGLDGQSYWHLLLEYCGYVVLMTRTVYLLERRLPLTTRISRSQDWVGVQN